MKAVFEAEKKLQSKIGKYDYILFFSVGIILALVVRLCLFNFESLDYSNFLSTWYDFIKNNGGFKALKYGFSNYSPPYVYLLVACTYIPIHKLYAIKLVSVLFDLMAAVLVYLIVGMKFKSKLIPVFAFFTVLFMPTVIVNGALWGQCDIIYTCWLLISVIFLMKEKYFRSILFYSIAFAFKLQAIFLLPLFVILYFRKRFSILNFLIIPGTYILLSIPCLMAGRPLDEVLLIYADQTSTYNYLTLNAPSIYQWVPIYDIGVDIAAIAFGFMVIFTFCFICYRGLKNIDSQTIIKLVMCTLLIVPFVLPQMHERYFFAADVFSIIYAFYFPAYFYVPVLVGLVSYFSYYPYIFSSDPFINVGYLAFVLLVLIFIVANDLYKTSFNKIKLFKE